MSSSKSSSSFTQSVDFKRLVRTRWTVSCLLSLVMMGSYFSFILLLALRRDILAMRFFSGSLPLGIVVGFSLILLACLLTGIYVLWANVSYDEQIKALIAKSRKKED